MVKMKRRRKKMKRGLVKTGFGPPLSGGTELGPIVTRYKPLPRTHASQKREERKNEPV